MGGGPRSSVMDPSAGWFQSPIPSRTTTPLPTNKLSRHLGLDDGGEQSTALPYRSRMRPDKKSSAEVGSFIHQGLNSGDHLTSKMDQVRLSGVQESEPSPAEYELLYSKDEPGEEMSELARVWRVYIAEATKFDVSLTEGCNRGIDVLLVFTGLFSAVLTTFIIQSYQLMIPDPNETTNRLLTQLVNQMNSSHPRDESPPPNTRSQMHWVNGLWFAALSCGLSTALISMLAKQWLQAYTPNISGSLRHRARQRQSRYMQLEAWHVLALINALPLLLHVALLLFFAGLIVLLWPIDIAITIATWIIVSSAYGFYFASIWLPLIYPDCPYQHPLSDHLRKWLSRPASLFGNPAFRNYSTDDLENQELWKYKKPASVSPDDVLDASALVWLFTSSTDKQVISTALQAIAALPRDFSAIHILRNAGALQLVEQGFQRCFDKDTTVDVKWRLNDPDGAWIYCRAWMSLTRGTLEQWPWELLEPLWRLQDLKDHPDVAGIASCAIALSSSETHQSQWELFGYLSRYIAGEIQLTPSTVCYLLDSILEGLVRWEMPIAVIEKTTIRAVPLLLRLLQLSEDLPTSDVRNATALVLYVLTHGSVDINAYRSEERRRTNYCEVILSSLSIIATVPARFGVEGPLLDAAALELSRLASPVLLQSHRFTDGQKDMARASLYELFMTDRIGVGIVPDSVLADVLHLLNQVKSKEEDHPALVNKVVQTLLKTSHMGVASWSVRLLRPILTGCSVPVVQAFTESNGINAVLRAARAGDIDNRRLQIDSWRTLCAFINASTTLYNQRGEGKEPPPSPKTPTPSSVESQFEAIFESDFFETLCSVIASRRWWLFEVNGLWAPTLVNLCRLRPYESAWRTVSKVIEDVGDEGQLHNGLFEILYQLDTVLQESLKDDQASLERPTSPNLMTMMEQRLEVKTSSRSQARGVSNNSTSTSTWF